ncbi:beta-lactamase/transpeptidase-like protein [Exophiala viscosa]|uniref:Beta-lactamase/transpeptidase-like protein n=1 Tax=Exophiala viscosa TaxID=2486360 RepID=A0AAN6DUS5_9EURO|nr:beta-lactamase/transpeptidase-like protein [Exophiala viscosa]
MSLNYVHIQAQFLCPPLGPIFPAPTSLSGYNFPAGNRTNQSRPPERQFPAQRIRRLSWDSLNTSGTHNVTGDTEISTFPTQSRKYIRRLNNLPQNNNNLTTVDLGAVTIEALPAHLGGIPADLTNSALFYLAELGQELAPSQLSAAQASLTCGGFAGSTGCSWDVYAPWTTPVYSNVGYALLGLVIENVSGKTYADYLQENILHPSNMNCTSVGAPLNSSIGFIPAETNWWGTPFGFENSSGGIYASNNDLSSFGTALLSSQLLTPAATRTWMKPKTFTPSSGVSETTPGFIALVPDYDLVFAINMAGPDNSLTAIQILLSSVATALVPAVDDVAKATAAQKYSGTYVAAGMSSITFAVDDGGLFVSAFTANGADVLVGYAAMEGADTGNTSIRLYPTGLSSGNESAWRAVYNPNSAEELADVDAQLFFPQGSCQSWSEMDLTTYGLQALDYFVFTEHANDTVTTVAPRAWRLVLNRAD